MCKDPPVTPFIKGGGGLMAAITSSTRTDPVQAETSKTAPHHNKPLRKKSNEEIAVRIKMKKYCKQSY